LGLTQTSCTGEEIDYLQERSKIVKYYDSLTEDATDNEKELKKFDCLSRWKVK